MNDTDRFMLKLVVAFFVGGCVLAMSITWFTASMEARSYRRFCDTPVTWWDAVWLDLRIDECGTSS